MQFILSHVSTAIPLCLTSVFTRNYEQFLVLENTATNRRWREAVRDPQGDEKEKVRQGPMRKACGRPPARPVQPTSGAGNPFSFSLSWDPQKPLATEHQMLNTEY